MKQRIIIAANDVEDYSEAGGAAAADEYASTTFETKSSPYSYNNNRNVRS